MTDGMYGFMRDSFEADDWRVEVIRIASSSIDDGEALGRSSSWGNVGKDD